MIYVFENDMPFNETDVQFFFDVINSRVGIEVNAEDEVYLRTIRAQKIYDVKILFRSVTDLVSGLDTNIGVQSIDGYSRIIGYKNECLIFELVLDKKIIANQALETLYHELTHIQQMCTYRLEFMHCDNYEQWHYYWEGNYWPTSKKPTHAEYMDFPWEVEARAVGNFMTIARIYNRWKTNGINLVEAAQQLGFVENIAYQRVVKPVLWGLNE